MRRVALVMLVSVPCFAGDCRTEKFETELVKEACADGGQRRAYASLRILEDYVTRERAAGKDPTAVARGALENAIKFLDTQPLEIRRSVLASYERIFGALPKDAE